MKKTWIAALFLLVAVTAGAVFWMTRGAGKGATRWTTSSPEARAEFERGLEAEMKYYEDDALAHFERALELDPAFVMPRVRLIRLLRYRDKDRYRDELEALRGAAAEGLASRERFLLAYTLARQDRANARADALLDEFLAASPDEPFALSLRCTHLFERRDWTAAAECNQRLIKVDPNWVNAQNQLGYIAMAQGRFAESEQAFRTYLFIAPDQANPYDSMGELQTLIGKYPEARASLERAVAIKPDFCGSWSHLVTLEALRADAAAVSAILARVDEMGVCDKRWRAEEECRAMAWEAAWRGDRVATWERPAAAGCFDGPGGLRALAARAAVYSGRPDFLAAFEERLRKFEEAAGGEAFARAYVAHVQGLRSTVAGRWGEAAERFLAADRDLYYWGDGQGLFKLWNRLDLANAQRRAGQTAEAEATRVEVERINADFARRFASFFPPPAS